MPADNAEILCVVRRDGLLGIALSRQVLRHLLGGGGKILIGDDVVSIKHMPRPVAAYRHRNFFRNAGAHHIPYRAPAKIMKQPAIKFGSVAGRLPRLIERSQSRTIAVVKYPVKTRVLLVALRFSAVSKHPSCSP